jgi:hypothetical protein
MKGTSFKIIVRNNHETKNSFYLILSFPQVENDVDKETCFKQNVTYKLLLISLDWMIIFFIWKL